MYNCDRGGRESISGKVRGRFEKTNRGREIGFPRKHREDSEEPSRGPAPDPPVGILYGNLIIPLLEPSSEFVIMELHKIKTIENERDIPNRIKGRGAEPLRRRGSRTADEEGEANRCGKRSTQTVWSLGESEPPRTDSICVIPKFIVAILSNIFNILIVQCRSCDFHSRGEIRNHR